MSPRPSSSDTFEKLLSENLDEKKTLNPKKIRALRKTLLIQKADFIRQEMSDNRIHLQKKLSPFYWLSSPFLSLTKTKLLRNWIKNYPLLSHLFSLAINVPLAGKVIKKVSGPAKWLTLGMVAIKLVRMLRRNKKIQK